MPFTKYKSEICVTQHDVDGDGIFDILICTSQAELLALSANGSPIEGKHYQVRIEEFYCQT